MKVSRILMRGTAVLTLVAVTALPALAQRGKWWQDERFRRELGLTQEQSDRLEAIFQAMQPALRQQAHLLDKAEKEFDRLVETADDEAVMQYVGTVEAARAELNKARTLMLLRMRRSLTSDQWAKFTALADERNRQRTVDRRQR